MDQTELRKLDYEKTLEHANQLWDARFKLLALVPVATGAGLGLAEPEKSPLSGLCLGLLGFFVTVGVVFYDQRNSEIYEMQMHRARLLELQLNMPPVTGAGKTGGPVGGRPARNRKLFGRVMMWHDRGLAFIYSAVLGAWSYLVSASMVTLISDKGEALRAAISIAVAVLVAGLSWSQLHKLDAPSEEVEHLKNEIRGLEQGRS